MSPERRKRVVEALRAIVKETTSESASEGLRFAPDFDDMTDAELTSKLVNIEALVDRAQGTDI